MRLIRVAVLVSATLALGGCFQSSTVVHVDADGSGTIQLRTAFTGAALAQVKQLTLLAAPNAKAPDLLSEDQARAMAASLGSGVTYVTSTPIKTDQFEGRESVYKFADVNQLRMTQQPQSPGGVSVRADSLGSSKSIAFRLEHEPNGLVLLHVAMPDLAAPGVPGLPSTTGADAPPSAITDQQLALVKRTFAGMRVDVTVETGGRIVKTNAPFVEGNRVILMSIDFDQILQNEDALRSLQPGTTPEAALAVLKTLPGVRITVERDVTIEFAPEGL